MAKEASSASSPSAGTAPSAGPKMTLEDIRYWCRNSLFFLCQLLFEDIVEEPHGNICRFIEQEGLPIPAKAYKFHRDTVTIQPKYQLLIGARKMLKTSIKQAYMVQLALKNPELRILDLSNTIPNAIIDLSMIKQLLKHPTLEAAFPEIIPSDYEIARNQVVWSQERVCVKRNGTYPEPTFTAAGLKKQLTQRHFNIIIPDDIVTAKLDTMTAQEIRPSPMDVEKAWGYDQTQLYGLLEEKPTHRGDPEVLYPSKVLSLNNRWGPDDYVDRLLRFRPEYEVLEIPVIWPNDHSDEEKRGMPTWPSGPMGTMQDCERVRATMSSYIWNTQMLCNPIDPKENVFQQEWFQYYTLRPPELVNIVAAMDPALSLDKGACFTAVVVVGQDKDGCWYVLDAVRDHLDTNGQLNLIFSLADVWKPQQFAVEDVLFQTKILDCVQKDPRYAMLSEWGVSMFGIHPPKGDSKDNRIEALQPRFRNKMIVLKREQTELVHELVRFRRNTSSTRDLVDALAYVPRMLFSPETQRRRAKLVNEPLLQDGIPFEDVEAEILSSQSIDEFFAEGGGEPEGGYGYYTSNYDNQNN